MSNTNKTTVPEITKEMANKNPTLISSPLSPLSTWFIPLKVIGIRWVLWLKTFPLEVDLEEID